MGRLQEIIGKLSSNYKPKSSGINSYSLCCPCHDDGTQSLSITEKDSKILLFCHAGCSFDSVRSSIEKDIGETLNVLKEKKMQLVVNNEGREKVIVAVHKYVTKEGNSACVSVYLYSCSVELVSSILHIMNN
jgi:hypothetical protein